MIVSTIVLTIMHAITMIYFIWKAITCAKESQPIAIWIMNDIIGIVAFIILKASKSKGNPLRYSIPFRNTISNRFCP